MVLRLLLGVVFCVYMGLDSKRHMRGVYERDVACILLYIYIQVQRHSLMYGENMIWKNMLIAC